MRFRLSYFTGRVVYRQHRWQFWRPEMPAWMRVPRNY